jgi:hypothetical protein
MKKKVLYNRYYEHLSEFDSACVIFFMEFEKIGLNLKLFKMITFKSWEPENSSVMDITQGLEE